MIKPFVFQPVAGFMEDFQSIDRVNRPHIEPRILGFKADFMCIDDVIDTEDAPHQGKVKKSYHKINDKHIMRKNK